MLQEAVEEFDQLSKSQVHSIARVLMCVPFDCGVQECSRDIKRAWHSSTLSAWKTVATACRDFCIRLKSFRGYQSWLVTYIFRILWMLCQSDGVWTCLDMLGLQHIWRTRDLPWQRQWSWFPILPRKTLLSSSFCLGATGQFWGFNVASYKCAVCAFDRTTGSFSV